MRAMLAVLLFFFFQAEDGIRDLTVTGVQTCALPISNVWSASPTAASSPSASSPAHSAAAPATRAPPSVNAASVRVTVPARVRGYGVRNAPGDATSRTGFGPAQRGGRSPERAARRAPSTARALPPRSEEHTSELQSQSNLVCRLLLEKKKN